jgi:hypothetical protein
MKDWGLKTGATYGKGRKTQVILIENTFKKKKCLSSRRFEFD